MLNKDLLSRLKRAGALADQRPDLGFVSTGNLALNEVITGDFNKGVPIGGITQFIGESSTAKTVFLTHTLIEAQKAGYYAILNDAENAYSADFAAKLGLDPENLFPSHDLRQPQLEYLDLIL